MKQLVEMIKDSDVGPNRVLHYKKRPLRVGGLKTAMDHFFVDRGVESVEDAIIAVGTKGFDWHYLGLHADPLKAEAPIILDVFPRLKMDRYVADVTRTVVKGTVSMKVRNMFDSVLAARDAALDVLTDGAVIDDVNLACFNTLKSLGFDSRRLNPSAKDGMTHGLGHGIGLEIHENPSMYNRTAEFSSGHIMAIEPGVYLKPTGGVRVENDYEVTAKRPKCLTSGLDELLFV
jgi:Xaa-Pro aminopeptidase